MELKEYLIPLRKWWWLIVAATLVATVSGFIATRQQSPIYRTHTTIMIGSAINNPNPNSNDFWLTQQLANTYADVAQRDTVRNATMAALNLTWLPDFTARVVANTQLLEISVTDTDPQRAAAVANEVAHQLVQVSPTGSGGEDQQRQAFVSQQLSDLEAKILETQNEIAKKQADLANLFSARQIADTQTQITGLQGKLTTLQANYAALLSNTQRGALNSISIIETAAAPTVPVGPNKPATILLAAAIGFILAAAAAYLLEYLDDSLKNPDDIQKALGLTTLGAVPVLESDTGSELIMFAHSPSPASEAYRVLRTNLQFAAVERPLTTLMITSPGTSEGKSLTAANLAGALAQTGRRVVVIDTDLHRPRLHKLFGLHNSAGVTTALISADTRGLQELLQPTAEPGLHVLTSGPLPPNPAELLGSARMKQLLADLLTLADIIVLDSPPVTALSDAAILATQVDGVLMVLEAGVTRREIAKRAMTALRNVHARVIGALLNRMPAKGSGYYYYYSYGQYYTSADGHDGGSGDGGNGRRSHGAGKHRARRGSAPQPEKTALSQP